MLYIIYILLAAAAAGWFYWDRINMDYYDVDHYFDIPLAVIVGFAFPVTIPFALPFSYLRKLKEKRKDK